MCDIFVVTGMTSTDSKLRLANEVGVTTRVPVSWSTKSFFSEEKTTILENSSQKHSSKLLLRILDYKESQKIWILNCHQVLVLLLLLRYQIQLSFWRRHASNRGKKQSNRRLLGQSDDFDQDIMIGNAASERQENVVRTETLLLVPLLIN